jgi:hypothetical protein
MNGREATDARSRTSSSVAGRRWILRAAASAEGGTRNLPRLRVVMPAPLRDREDTEPIQSFIPDSIHYWRSALRSCLAPVYKLSSPSDASALRPRATNLSNPWFSRHFWSTRLNTPRAEVLSICMTYLSKWQFAPKTPRLPHYTLFFSAICFLTRLLAILDGLSYDLS